MHPGRGCACGYPMRSFLVATCVLVAFAGILVLAPSAAATGPVCVGYDDCAPCDEGYAWIGVENPVKGTWTCGQCEACGNPI